MPVLRTSGINPDVRSAVISPQTGTLYAFNPYGVSPTGQQFTGQVNVGGGTGAQMTGGRAATGGADLVPIGATYKQAVAQNLDTAFFGGLGSGAIRDPETGQIANRSDAAGEKIYEKYLKMKGAEGAAEAAAAKAAKETALRESRDAELAKRKRDQDVAEAALAQEKAKIDNQIRAFENQRNKFLPGKVKEQYDALMKRVDNYNNMASKWNAREIGLSQQLELQQKQQQQQQAGLGFIMPKFGPTNYGYGLDANVGKIVSPVTGEETLGINYGGFASEIILGPKKNIVGLKPKNVDVRATVQRIEPWQTPPSFLVSRGNTIGEIVGTGIHRVQKISQLPLNEQAEVVSAAFGFATSEKERQLSLSKMRAPIVGETPAMTMARIAMVSGLIGKKAQKTKVPKMVVTEKESSQMFYKAEKAIGDFGELIGTTTADIGTTIGTAKLSDVLGIPKQLSEARYSILGIKNVGRGGGGGGGGAETPASETAFGSMTFGEVSRKGLARVPPLSLLPLSIEERERITGRFERTPSEIEQMRAGAGMVGRAGMEIGTTFLPGPIGIGRRALAIIATQTPAEAAFTIGTGAAIGFAGKWGLGYTSVGRKAERLISPAGFGLLAVGTGAGLIEASASENYEDAVARFSGSMSGALVGGELGSKAFDYLVSGGGIPVKTNLKKGARAVMQQTKGSNQIDIFIEGTREDFYKGKIGSIRTETNVKIPVSEEIIAKVPRLKGEMADFALRAKQLTGDGEDIFGLTTTKAYGQTNKVPTLEEFFSWDTIGSMETRTPFGKPMTRTIMFEPRETTGYTDILTPEKRFVMTSAFSKGEIKLTEAEQQVLNSLFQKQIILGTSGGTEFGQTAYPEETRMRVGTSKTAAKTGEKLFEIDVGKDMTFLYDEASLKDAYGTTKPNLGDVKTYLKRGFGITEEPTVIRTTIGEKIPAEEMFSSKLASNVLGEIGGKSYTGTVYQDIYGKVVGKGGIESSFVGDIVAGYNIKGGPVINIQGLSLEGLELTPSQYSDLQTFTGAKTPLSKTFKPEASEFRGFFENLKIGGPAAAVSYSGAGQAVKQTQEYKSLSNLITAITSGGKASGAAAAALAKPVSIPEPKTLAALAALPMAGGTSGGIPGSYSELSRGLSRVAIDIEPFGTTFIERIPTGPSSYKTGIPEIDKYTGQYGAQAPSREGATTEINKMFKPPDQFADFRESSKIVSPEFKSLMNIQGPISEDFVGGTSKSLEKSIGAGGYSDWLKEQIKTENKLREQALANEAARTQNLSQSSTGKEVSPGKSSSLSQILGGQKGTTSEFERNASRLSPLTTGKTKTNLYNLVGTTPLTGQSSATTQRTKDLEIPRYGEQFIPIETTTPGQKISPIVVPMFSFRMFQPQKQKMNLKLLEITPPIPIPTINIPPSKLDLPSFNFRQSKKGDFGFKVQVREPGTKARGKFISGKFKTLPSLKDLVLSKSEALALGQKKVADVAKRSFRLIPAYGKQAKYTGPKFKPQMFSRKGRTYIEKVKYAIDTFGELQEITFKGLSTLPKGRRASLLSLTTTVGPFKKKTKTKRRKKK